MRKASRRSQGAQPWSRTTCSRPRASRSDIASRSTRSSPALDERLLRRILDDALGAETAEKSGGPGEAGTDTPLDELEGRPGVAELEVDAASVLDRPGSADRLERGAIGRRDRSLVALRRGKLASPHRRAADRDVALDATVRAAAVRAGRRAETFAIAGGGRPPEGA